MKNVKQTHTERELGHGRDTETGRKEARRETHVEKDMETKIQGEQRDPERPRNGKTDRDGEADRGREILREKRVSKPTERLRKTRDPKGNLGGGGRPQSLWGAPPGSGPLKPPSRLPRTPAASIRRPRPRPPPRVIRTSGAVRAPGAEARWPAAEAGPRREPSAGGSPAMHHPPSGR